MNAAMAWKTALLSASFAGTVGCNAISGVGDFDFGNGSLSGAGSIGGTGGAGGAGGAGGSGGTAGDGPARIPTDEMLLWLAADRGVEEEDGAVSRWEDQSGNDNTATQGIPGARPSRSIAVGGTGGGAADGGTAELPMVHFDGVNDALDLGPGFADFDEGLSFFAVARLAEDLDCPAILSFHNGAEEDDVCFARNGGAPIYEVSDSEIQGDPGTFAPMQTALLSVVHTPPDLAEIRLNGSFVKSGQLALPANHQRRNNFVGRTLYAGCPLFKGEIAEIILYRRAVREDERAQIEEYLQSRWSCCR